MPQGIKRSLSPADASLRRIPKKKKTTSTNVKSESPPGPKVEDALMKHQLRTLKHVQRFQTMLPGLLLWWTMGWGKTRGAIFLLELGWSQVKSILVITRATALHTFNEELEKLRTEGWNFDGSRYTTVSYETFCLHPDRYTGFDALVLDESHYIRNSMSQRFPVILDLCAKTRIKLVLSGTPAVNHPCDVGTLINCILADDRERQTCTRKVKSDEYYGVGRQPFLPTTRVTWDHRYGEKTNVNLKHLKFYLNGLVSFFEGDTDNPDYATHFPRVVRRTMFIPMTPEHYQTYKEVEKKHRPDAEKRRKQRSKKKAFEAEQKVFTERGFGSFRKGLGMEQAESMEFLAYTMYLRQASNYVSDELATKLRAVMAHTVKQLREDRTYRVVIHSNFLKCGIHYFARMYRHLKMPFSLIDGSTKDVPQQIKRYNDGQTRIMLLSSAGCEGINLMATTEMFIVELHWNKTKPQQTEHRVIRYDSHASCQNKTVTIYTLVSTRPKDQPETALKPVDHLLHEICNNKQDSIDNFRSLVKRSGILNTEVPDRFKALQALVG